MKQAQNSDSKTHVKKQNPTSSTEISRKSLKYLFLETPCMWNGTVVMNIVLNTASSNVHRQTSVFQSWRCRTTFWSSWAPMGAGSAQLLQSNLFLDFLSNYFSEALLHWTSFAVSCDSDRAIIAKLSDSQIRSWVALSLLVGCSSVRPSVRIGDIFTYLNRMMF